MNVETIKMDRFEARDQAAIIRQQLLKRHSAEVKTEWEASLAAYEQLAKGTPLIDPRKAIESAGLGADGRPLLAFCRADKKRVTWSGSRDGWWDHGKTVGVTRIVAGSFRWGQHDSARFSHGEIFPTAGVVSSGARAEAIVPMIPAHCYPSRGNGSPSDWYILWEADWKAAPVDPILLKPIPNTTLYAVLATWDLTPVERAVIEQTRRA